MTIRSDNADLRLTKKGERQPMFLLACFLSLSAQSLNDESDPRTDAVVWPLLARKAGVISDYRWNLLISTASEMDRARDLLESASLSPQARFTFLHPTSPAE